MDTQASSKQAQKAHYKNALINVEVIQDMTYNTYIYICDHNMFMYILILTKASENSGDLFISMSIVTSEMTTYIWKLPITENVVP